MSKKSIATIHISNPADHIVVLEIDNPPANNLSKKLKRRFNDLLDELEKNNTIRVLIITGKGKGFCAGDDLKEALESAETSEAIGASVKSFGEILNRVEALPFAVIAAINGWCVGGGLELALCCDIRLAAVTSNFICAGVNVGLTASGYRLPRTIGIGHAKYMLYTGTSIPAEKAMTYGLVTDVYPVDELLSESLSLAKLIASKAPLAVQATKRIVNTAFETDLSTSLALQDEELLVLTQSQDHKAALKAFSIKDRPIFEGK